MLLDYQFNDPDLLLQALTHRSLNTKYNYERLEFIGDSVLGLIITDKLYHLYPRESEGVLTRMRAFLVRGERLSQLALEQGLDHQLNLGQGELKSGGKQNKSILEDCFEAVIGAIYLDAGFKKTQEIVLELYTDSISELSLEKLKLKDNKTKLQELLQGIGRPLPVYKLLSATGKPPTELFKVACVLLDTEESVEEEASSRKLAEQKAASSMLKHLDA